MSYYVTDKDRRKVLQARKDLGQKGMRLIYDKKERLIAFSFFYDKENLTIAKRKLKKKRSK